MCVNRRRTVSNTKKDHCCIGCFDFISKGSDAVFVSGYEVEGTVITYI